MSAGLTPGEPVGPDPDAQHQPEPSNGHRTRGVVHKRPSDFAGLRRPAARAARALERRLEPVRAPLVAAGGRLQALFDRRLMNIAAFGRRAPEDRGDLSSVLARLPAPPSDERRVTLIVVGGHEPGNVGIRGSRPVDVVAIEPSDGLVSAVRSAIAASDDELVGLMLGTTVPVETTWLDRLAAELGDGVVAAAPVVLHPVRHGPRATPHDGRVRSAGLILTLTPEGIPVASAVAVGAEPDPRALATDVASASAACLLVDHAAYDGAGGLTVGHDLDVAVVELCARLRSGGARVVAVPSAVVVDHRPVRSRRDLAGPVDPHGRAWHEAIGRSGAVLRRVAQPEPSDSLRFALTIAAPSAKVARRWGDWHLAEGLAGGLRRAGHEVRVQTADEADHPAGRSCDVHLVLRGLAPVRRSEGQRHVLWIISHPEAIEDGELDAADLVLVASTRFAEHVRGRTATPVEVLLQATDHRRFFPRSADPAFAHPVTVVAKTRDVLRPIVADAIAAGIRPAIYGGGWRGLVDPALLVADHLENAAVPIVYSSAGVVLNDHWATMQKWGFVSNRLYDVLACGAPVISDPVPGLDELFEGAVLEYRTPAELRALVDQVLADPEAARARADGGRAIVLARHTFDHRAGELLEALGRNA